jgi:hypothetical protein
MRFTSPNIKSDALRQFFEDLMGVWSGPVWFGLVWEPWAYSQNLFSFQSY